MPGMDSTSHEFTRVNDIKKMNTLSKMLEMFKAQTSTRSTGISIPSRKQDALLNFKLT